MYREVSLNTGWCTNSVVL